MTKSPVMFKYRGEGAFLAGVPARSLTEDDWGELDGDQRKLVRDNAKFADDPETKHVAIYEEAESDKPAPKADKPAEKKEG